MFSQHWFSHQCHTLLRSSSSMEKYTKRIQAPTRFSMSRTVSSRAWNWDDTIPMKIWPLRAWTQSSFSKPSPIPSETHTVHVYVRVGRFDLCKFYLCIYLSIIHPSTNGSIDQQTIILRYIFFHSTVQIVSWTDNVSHHQSSSCSCGCRVWWGWYWEAPPQKIVWGLEPAPHTFHWAAQTMPPA